MIQDDENLVHTVLIQVERLYLLRNEAGAETMKDAGKWAKRELDPATFPSRIRIEKLEKWRSVCSCWAILAIAHQGQCRFAAAIQADERDATDGSRGNILELPEALTPGSDGDHVLSIHAEASVLAAARARREADDGQ